MCFLILGSLSLCSVSVFFHFGKPTFAFCILRFLPCLLFFTVCLACFAVRSFQILFIFKIAQKYPSFSRLWVKCRGQWLVILVALVVQGLLLLLASLSSPPRPYNKIFWYHDKIVLSCNTLFVFSASTAFLSLLCLLCFIFSYMAKELPENYNEAKAITFCLFLLNLTWIDHRRGFSGAIYRMPKCNQHKR